MRRLTLIASLVVLAACSQGNAPTDVDAGETMDAPPPPVIITFEPTIVGAALIGDALALEPEIEGGMLENGYHTSKVPAADVLTGIHGSFGPDRDRGMGSVTYAIDAATGPVAMPLVTGPGAGAMTISAHCGELETEAEILPVTEEWTWFQVPVADCGEGAPAYVTIRDAGSEWGQWLAIGEPHLILPEVTEEAPAEDTPAGE